MFLLRILHLLLNLFITLLVFFLIWEMLSRELDIQPKRYGHMLVAPAAIKGNCISTYRTF